jgi:hypothetical protein
MKHNTIKYCITNEENHRCSYVSDVPYLQTIDALINIMSSDRALTSFLSVDRASTATMARTPVCWPVWSYN